MNAKSQPTVAVSYSWKTERAGPYQEAVDQFCELLEAGRIGVLRDTKEVQVGEDLIQFMRDLGSGNRICVFLSDSYLKSENCMYELTTAWRRSPDNSQEFDQRVKVWVMKDAVSIHQPEDRDRLRDFWVEQRDRAAARVDRCKVQKVSAAKAEDTANRIRQIAEHTHDLLEHIHERLSPADIGAFAAWIKTSFPGNPSPAGSNGGTHRTAPAGATPGSTDQPQPPILLEVVYAAVFTDLDLQIRNHANVAAFIARVCPGCLVQSAEHPVVRRRDSNDRHEYAAVIETVAGQIHEFTGGVSDRRALGLIIGGFAVLTVDPSWVLYQRHALNGGVVEVPAREGLLSIEDGQRVDFLHLIVRALVGGLGTLGSMVSCDDPRRVRQTFAESQRGVGEPSLVPAIMRYVIRVTRPTTAGLDLLSGKQLEDEFAKSKQTLQSVRRKRQPFWIPDGNTARHLRPHRNDLALEDLLMVLPSGSGTEEALVKDVMDLVSNLKDIFEHLKPDLQ